MTDHIVARLRERVPSPAETTAILARLHAGLRALPATGAYALYLYRTPDHRGDTGAYRARTVSNGTLYVIIVRDGRPVTGMWRRTDQPATPAALHVDRVLWHRDAR